MWVTRAFLCKAVHFREDCKENKPKKNIYTKKVSIGCALFTVRAFAWVRYLNHDADLQDLPITHCTQPSLFLSPFQSHNFQLVLILSYYAQCEDSFLYIVFFVYMYITCFFPCSQLPNWHTKLQECDVLAPLGTQQLVIFSSSACLYSSQTLINFIQRLSLRKGTDR